MITSTNIRKKARNSLSGNWGKGVLIVLLFVLVEFILNLFSSLTALIPLFNIIISIAILIISVPLSFGLAISFVKLKRGKEVSGFDFFTLGFNYFSRSWAISFRTLLALIVPVIIVIVTTLALSISISISLSASLFSAADSAIVSTRATIDYEEALLDYMENPSAINKNRLDNAQQVLDSSKTTSPTPVKESIFPVIIQILLLISIFVANFYLVVKSLLYVLSNFIAYDNPELSAKEVVQMSKNLMQGNRGNYFILSLSFIGWMILSYFTFGIGLLWLIPYMQVSFVCFYENLIEENNLSQEE